MIHTRVGDRKYAIVLIAKNGNLITRHALETSGVVWPVISLNSPDAVINIDPKPILDKVHVETGIIFITFDSFVTYLIFVCSISNQLFSLFCRNKILS